MLKGIELMVAFSVHFQAFLFFFLFLSVSSFLGGRE